MTDARLEQLADRLADLVADRLADRLLEVSAFGQIEPTDAEGRIDAAEVARRYGVTRHFVYEHADELGAIRLGKGQRARLRFDPATVADALAPRPAPVTDPHRKPRRGKLAREVELLPIRGKS
jgi:hypothetical protein